MTKTNPATELPTTVLTPAALTQAERRALKARAHNLEPVVLMGDKGLSSAVHAEIERALAAHELVKIRAQAERGERAVLLADICGRTGASAVQRIGKMLVIYRKKPPLDDEAEDRARVRKDAARKAKGRKKDEGKAPRKAAPKPGSRTGIKFRARSATRSTPRSDTRPARGTGRPGSRTASPRQGPERPLRRPRTSR